MNCRLLYLIGQLRAGGSERQLYHLLQAMNRDRYKPAVAVWNYHAEQPYVSHVRALGIPLHPLPYGSPGRIGLRALRRLIRRIKPEVIHSSSSYTRFAAWWGALGSQAVAVGALRSDFIEALKDNGRWLGRLSARWPRAQIFNNLAAADIVRRLKSPFTPAQLHVVRNGIDLQHFRALPLATTGPACILGIGSLLPVKRWDRLLEAARSLRRQGLDFRVRIVGDGPLHASLQQRAQALDITDCVEITGYREDIPALLAAATFLVHPSDSEGCPNVVMEAMACGRAVVASDVGDTAALVDDQKTGFLVPRRDDTMLIECMAALIVDRELCRRTGEAGRLKAEHEFGLDRLVSETLAAYRASGWKDS